MKLPVARRNGQATLPGITGKARLGRRTKSLVARLKPGDIAVIDHVDLDQTSAQALVDAEVAAVVNVSPSTSGRYPNRGPRVLVDAGVLLVDAVEGPVFTHLHDGDQVRVHEGVLFHGDVAVGEGTVLDCELVGSATDAARGGMASQLETFSANAMEFIRREGDLLLDGAEVPETRTSFRDRPVVVVSKSFEYQQDLRRLKRFIREQKPLLVGVEAGADVLLDLGQQPQLIVGESDAISDRALRCGAEVILRAPRDGNGVPSGLDRLDRLGVSATLFHTSAASEDAAMLLADTGGARLVVSVGGHTGLEEYLDRGRSAMASSFLTRLRVGPKLVDARAVSSLYQSRVRTWQLVLLALVGLLAVAGAIAATPVGQEWWHSLNQAAIEAWTWAQGRFP